MKNNLKLSNYITKLFFVVIIIIITMTSIYLSTNNIFEGNENINKTYDCSKCELKPSSSNCYYIKQFDISNDKLIISNDDILFCPWKPNAIDCYDGSYSDVRNINNKNTICCSGSDFYDNNTYLLQEVKTIKDNSNICSKDKFKNHQYCINLNNELNNFDNIKGSLFMIDNTDTYSTINEMGQTVSGENTIYKLLDNIEDPISDDYILNDYQFFNCFGEIKGKSINDMSFSEQQLLDFSNNDYFKVAEDATYTTINDTSLREYPNNQDIEMEIKRLETIPNNHSVAPVNVIKTYLDSINSFYKDQLSRLDNTATNNNLNKELIFENNDLSIKESTFFTFDNQSNEQYNCTNNSITGDQSFNYCGPEPYYDKDRIIW